jgi:hypothetical protein
MERRPSPSARKTTPAERRAKKLADEADAIARKIIAEQSKKTEDSEQELPPFAVDASGASELGAQDIATWTAASGWTPIEFLTHTYRNGWQRMEHRIAAAKAVLEYNHRKLPDKVEVDMQSKSLTLDATALSALSTKELALLEKLLEKAGKKDD